MRDCQPGVTGRAGAADFIGRFFLRALLPFPFISRCDLSLKGVHNS